MISRVTSLPVIVQRYSAWVCAETITLIEGVEPADDVLDRRPARLPAQPFERGGPAWKPPSWMTSTMA